MAPKTRKQIQREYRERKKLEKGALKIKTRAEIQRDYRQRKKNDAEYLQRERERKNNAYIPTSALNPRELSIRRKRNREYARRFREKRNNEEQKKNTPEENSSPLLVKLDFKRVPNKTRKQKSQALSKAKKKIKVLEENNEKLKRRSWQLEKRIQRSKPSTSHEAGIPKEQGQSETFDATPSTPRSTANRILRSAGLSPRKVPSVRKHLVVKEALLQEINTAVSVTNQEGSQLKKTRRKGLATSVISGKIIKKYRCIRAVSKDSAISRKMLSNTKGKLLYPVKKRLANKQKETCDLIGKFLERDDNSRIMPGKGDYKKVAGEKIQKRFLNDYMHNLHLKFLAENPHIRISRASFCRKRPRHIIPSSFSSRNTCLCQYHQNMTLAIASIKACGISVPTNPDVFIRENDNDQVESIMARLPDADIKHTQWKKTDVEGKKRMKLITQHMTRNEFQVAFKAQTSKFRGHVERVKIQYQQQKHLKESLRDDHVIVQMDFAENYVLQANEEIQSAYWNMAMVTLHPVVCYFKKNGTLAHKSLVFVSDELDHTSSTVHAFMKELVPFIKEIAPSVKQVHYITDSPTSQYRNKTIFYIVSMHERLYGLPATWSYFEAGHGKGPCDGVGGCVKRMADEAVKQQKATMQDAAEFFAWTQSIEESTRVTYKFVSKEKCATAKSEILSFGTLVPVPGTMKIHMVVSQRPGEVMWRETSCYCEQCFGEDGKFNFGSGCTWKKNRLLKDEGIMEEDNDKNTVTPSDNDWVAAIYDQKWYVGKVLEVDVAEKDALVSFMEPTSKVTSAWKFPRNNDEVWVDFECILCIIDAPRPRGKTKRIYYLEEDTLEVIEQLFQRWLKLN